MHVLARGLLNYDFLPRFERTMSINHNFDFYLRVGQQPPPGPEPLGVRLGQILGAAWINNLDFAAAIGFPIYIFFLAQAVRRVWRFIKGQAAHGDVILFALLLSFIVLNLAGTAQGEVPRLWLFWLPMVVLLARMSSNPLSERPHAAGAWRDPLVTDAHLPFQVCACSGRCTHVETYAIPHISAHRRPARDRPAICAQRLDVDYGSRSIWLPVGTPRRCAPATSDARLE
jgi:hypothetical protein